MRVELGLRGETLSALSASHCRLDALQLFRDALLVR
jgi:hypothetical protein